MKNFLIKNLKRKNIFLNKNVNCFSSSLKQELDEIIPQRVSMIKELKQKHGAKEVGKTTLDQVLGGMRGMKGLFYDISRLNSQTGITFRGITTKKKI